MSRPTLKLPAKPAGDTPVRTPGRKPVRGGPTNKSAKPFSGAPAGNKGPRAETSGDSKRPRQTGDRPFRADRSDRSERPAGSAPRGEYLPNGGKPRVRRDDNPAGSSARGEHPAGRPGYQGAADKPRYRGNDDRPARTERSERNERYDRSASKPAAAPTPPAARPEYIPGGRYRRDHETSTPSTATPARPEYLPNGGKPRYRSEEGDRPARDERPAGKPSYGYPPRGEGRSEQRGSYGNSSAGPRRTADGRPAAPRRDGDRPAYGGGGTGYGNNRPPRPAHAGPSGDRRPAYGARPAHPATPAKIAPAVTGDEGAPAIKRAGNDLPRLSKLMSEQGLCSRREADEWIENGWVKVDGEVVDTLGTRISPKAKIEIAPAAAQHQSESVTILLHKPIGYVSGQAEDGYEPAFVLVRPENRWEEDRSSRPLKQGHLRGLAPAGRLDIDSTGLLVLTQDGRVARRLVGDDSKVEKEYLVRVEGTLDEDGMKLLNHGLSLDGVKLKPANVSWQNEEQLRFVLREGKKRQIRRMCEMVGLHVVGLKRIRIGSVALGKLPVGTWRFLRSDEKF